MNKKESEDQAHVYVPTERKPKVEEPPRRLGHKEQPLEISQDAEAEAEDLITIKQPVNDVQQEPMDIGLDVDNSAVVEPKHIDESTYQKNLNNDTEHVDKNKKSCLTDEDFNNFERTISYVSKIPEHLVCLFRYFELFKILFDHSQIIYLFVI